VHKTKISNNGTLLQKALTNMVQQNKNSKHENAERFNLK
jgi:hypothetical protein